jgi:flagellar protein FliS
MARNVADKYQTQQILSASPAKLVAMLLDKAISSLHEAIRAIEAGEIEARWRANDRAMEIINHLWMTLDVEKGGEIAANLDRLYRFMLARLPEVDMHNNPGPARDVIGLLEPLRRSWHTVAERTKAAAPAGPAAAPPGQAAAKRPGEEPAKTNEPLVTGIALSA